MTDQLNIFDVRPKARSTDPATSHEAAPDPLTPDGLRRMTDGQYLVLSKFRRHGPMSDESLVVRLAGRLSPSGARTRRSELARLGALLPAGETVTASGRKTIVWKLAG